MTVCGRTLTACPLSNNNNDDDDDDDDDDNNKFVQCKNPYNVQIN